MSALRSERFFGATWKSCSILLALCGAIACRKASHGAGSESAGRFGPAASSKAQVTPLLAADDPSTTVLAIDAGVAGDRITGLLEIPKDQCAVLIARAGPSIEDVDLLAYGEDGSVVGTDEGPDKTPALVVCPPHPARVWVSARIAAGHGLVAVGAQRVRPADAGRIAKGYGIALAGDVGRQAQGAWRKLEERLAAHRLEIGGAWQDVRRVAVPLDARLPSRVSAPIDAGRCLDAFVVPSPEVGHLELLVLDLEGSILGRASSSGRERYLVVCTPADASVSIELRPQSGRGAGVLVLSRTRPGTEADLDAALIRIDTFPTREIGAEEAVIDAKLAASEGYPAGRSLFRGALEVGHRTSVPLTLAAGCTRVDVVAGRPLRGLESRAFAPSGELVSQAKSGGHSVLFACGLSSALRLDMEATLRGGPISVLARAEPDVPDALIANPLAAGRLLASMVSRGVLRRASDVGHVLETTLSETELQTLELTVPFGRCMDVTLALGKTAVGAEIRLVSTRTSNEIAIARGPHGTSARACALDAASAQSNLKTRAELRVAAGSGKALVATRMLSPSR